MTGVTPQLDPPVRFGTSGWRGVLGEEFTLPRLRAVIRGAGAWFRERGGGEVVVAHDTRFQADRMAVMAAQLLAESGLRVSADRGAVPTPCAVRAVVRRGAAGALVLTASHNPPEYQGVKVFGPCGGIDGVEARRIEALAARAGTAPPGAAHARARCDLRGTYVRELGRELDAERLARARPRVVYDAMHGAGAGVLDAVLTATGARVEMLRGAPDPNFGGAAPDPTARAQRGLRAAIRGSRGARLGVATDGDADRFAMLDETGRALSASQALALLVDHCVRTGRATAGVALSIATGSLVERVAASHGLAVTRHPIGFKHFRAPLASGRAELAGEESGGFAWGRFHPDKDGVLAASLLVEAAAVGLPLTARLAALERRHGRSHCGRIALPAAPRALERMAGLVRRPPGRVDGARVLNVRDDDGLHLSVDDGFLMLRASGTEPVLRVYAEASTRRGLSQRLARGAALLGLAGASSDTR